MTQSRQFSMRALLAVMICCCLMFAALASRQLWVLWFMVMTGNLLILWSIYRDDGRLALTGLGLLSAILLGPPLRSLLGIATYVFP